MLNAFEQFEVDMALDKSEFWTVRWWDLCRYHLAESRNVKGRQVSVKRPKRRNAFGKIFRLVFELVLRKKNAGAIFILSHPRLTQISEYEIIDIYTDSLSDEFGAEETVFHLDPPRTDDDKCRHRKAKVIPLDLVFVLAGIMYPFFYFIIRCSSSSENKLRHIYNAATARGLLSMDFVTFYDFVSSRVCRFLLHRTVYSFLFRIIPPRALILSVSNGNEAIISAVQNAGGVVFELQHGAPVSGKMNYDYRSGIGKTYAPDVFLGFGGFMTKQLPKFPSGMKEISMGFPFLTKYLTKKAPISGSKETANILLLSQNKIDRELSKWLEKNIDMISRHHIAIRLHPSYAGSNKEHPYTKFASIAALETNAVSLYEQLMWADVVVGGYSTALFEAAECGCAVLIVENCGGYLMQTFLREGYGVIAPPVLFADTMAELILQQTQKQMSSELFKQYQVGHFAEIVRSES